MGVDGLLTGLSYHQGQRRLFQVSAEL